MTVMSRSKLRLFTVLSNNPRRLFLIDGLGATLTAVMIGLVLPSLPNLFDMPTHILSLLARPAIVFAAYSFTCFMLLPKNWRWLLKGIAVANSAYCILSSYYLMTVYTVLNWLDLAYFTREIIVVILLVSIEWKAASKKVHKPAKWQVIIFHRNQ